MEDFLSNLCTDYPLLSEDPKLNLSSSHIYPSVHHKNHKEYSFDEILALDHNLALRIKYAAKSHYLYDEQCLNVNKSTSGHGT